MASLASQVVFHPVVSQSLKFGGTTLGRDKTYRTIQYFARFLAWHFLNKGNKDDAARWNALKTHLGTARKLMRLGKPMEHLQAALKASLSPDPPLEQITTIGRQIGYFGYLSADALVWANLIKFLKLEPETAKKIAQISNRFWVAGILFSIINGIFKLVRLAKESKRLRLTGPGKEKDLGQGANTEARLSAIESTRAATRRQFLIDLLDFWIPASGLELVNVSEGALGIFGCISSILGGKTQWESVNGKK